MESKMAGIFSAISRFVGRFNNQRPRNSFLDGHVMPPNLYKYIDGPVHAKEIIKAMNSVYFGHVTIPQIPLADVFTIRADFPLYDTHVDEIVKPPPSS
jgi:hypothetical protein